jgi:preprotein translocase subunit SecE
MKNPFRKIRIFYGETVTELKKASWPTRRELRDFTVVVFIAVVILGSFIAISDFSLMNWIEFFTELVRPEGGSRVSVS